MDDPAASGPAAPGPAAESRGRVLAGAYECVARFGMAKTTVDDVAKASGVSRATIYRLFPGGRDQLLRETVGWEMNRFFARLAEAVDDAPDFATLVEQALIFAHRAVNDHEVLQKVLVTEPDVLAGIGRPHRSGAGPRTGAQRAAGRDPGRPGRPRDLSREI
jgi:AcrR family transcriptional regulator